MSEERDPEEGRKLLVSGLRLITVIPWLQERSLGEVIDVWHYAQAQAVRKAELRARSGGRMVSTDGGSL